MHRLSWAIDGAIGIDTGSSYYLLVIVVLIAVISGKYGCSLIGIGIGIHLSTMIRIYLLEDILALGIRYALILFPVAIIYVLSDAKMSPSNRLSSRCIYHYIAYTLFRRLCFGNGIYI